MTNTAASPVIKVLAPIDDVELQQYSIGKELSSFSHEITKNMSSNQH
jgi:hypothetical protein